MSDWGPVFVALVLFVLLTPGLLFQVPGHHRCVEFGNFKTSGASILIHSLLYFGLICVFLLAIKRKLGLENKHGGLGTGGDSGGAICAVKSRVVVSVAREGQSGGVWEHANEWDFDSCAYHNLLWTYHHLPHRHSTCGPAHKAHADLTLSHLAPVYHEQSLVSATRTFFLVSEPFWRAILNSPRITHHRAARLNAQSFSAANSTSSSPAR
ncbi:hypothetical protein DITRI_Ditri17bG0084400 [Diplodiscus trichospermus]